MSRSWSALAVGIAGLILVETGATARSADRSMGADEMQARRIWELFHITPELEDNLIQVDVDDGIAVLEGSVDSEDERKQAQLLAHVEGILGVNNRLKVRRDVAAGRSRPSRR